MKIHDRSLWTRPSSAFAVAATLSLLSMVAFVGAARAELTRDQVSKDFSDWLESSPIVLTFVLTFSAAQAALDIPVETIKANLSQELLSKSQAGLIRLPISDLRRRLYLQKIMISRADTHTCALRGRNKIGYEPMLKHLTPSQFRDWFNVSKRAIVAAITQTPEAESTSDGQDEFNRRLENASPADLLIITNAVITKDEASSCAVMRWMISSALQDDSGDQEALIRYLVAQ